jgi:hypothetical protein
LERSSPADLTRSEEIQERGMAKKKSLLDRMEDNPAGDWTIADVKKLCAHHGLDIRLPNGGSHHIVSSQHLAGHANVPHKKPIKKGYIKNLVSYTRAHIERAERKADD